MNIDFLSFQPQGQFVSQVQAEIQEGKLPHALLLTGPEGVGKKTFASLIAASLLCGGQAPRPCGQCPSCIQFDAGTHPDFIQVQAGVPISPDADKGRTTIPVDDIREIVRQTGVHAYSGERRVILIQEAERMTPAAQNALLKTLEEPPAGTFFLLTCVAQDMLLPTIVSRCRSLRLHPWEDSIVEQVLRRAGVSADRAESSVRLAGGSIGKAIKMSADENYWRFQDRVREDFFGCDHRSDIFRVSAEWKERKEDLEALLDALETGFEYMLNERLHAFPLGTAKISNLYSPIWAEFAVHCELAEFSALLDAVAQARQQLRFSVNFQAVIEWLLMIMMEAKQAWQQ